MKILRGGSENVWTPEGGGGFEKIRGGGSKNLYTLNRKGGGS